MKRPRAGPYFFAWLRGAISLESQSSLHRPIRAPRKNGMTLPAIQNCIKGTVTLTPWKTHLENPPSPHPLPRNRGRGEG